MYKVCFRKNNMHMYNIQKKNLTGEKYKNLVNLGKGYTEMLNTILTSF